MKNEKMGTWKLLALIDEFTAQIYPPDSPSYRKAEIRKEEFVHALTQAYLLGRKEHSDDELIEMLRKKNQIEKENNSDLKKEIKELEKEIKEVRHYAGIDDVNVIRN